MAQPSGTLTLETDAGTDTFTFVNTANINQLWGNVASQVAQTGIMGEHTSEAGVFTPNAGDGGRTGVGNVSTSDEDFVPVGQDSVTLSGGAQGLHATYNGALLGGPEVPPDSVEATIGPLFPEPHGTLDVLIV